jgi:hypothetical protein
VLQPTGPVKTCVRPAPSIPTTSRAQHVRPTVITRRDRVPPPHPARRRRRPSQTAAMQAGVVRRAANVGFPSRSIIRGGFLLPGRARFFSGKPVNPRLPEAPPPQALLHLCCVDSLAFRVDARVEDTAAAPLRVDSLPQPRTHGRGGFAHLQAVDGEAPRLPGVLRGILLDHEVRSFNHSIAAMRSESIET